MRNINQIIRDLPPERRAKISTRASELIGEEKGEFRPMRFRTRMKYKLRDLAVDILGFRIAYQLGLFKLWYVSETKRERMKRRFQ